MRKIFAICILISIFTGCVVRSPIDSPLTPAENAFYQKTYGQCFKVDSFIKMVDKYVPWYKHRGKYSYTLEICLAESSDSVSAADIRPKADSTAAFIADYMEQEKMKLHKISLCYSLKQYTYVYIYSYLIDENNRPVLDE